jgi:DNA modification methylase
MRNIDGFPIGKDEDIIALSDPPFYTACPNPYIKQFIEEYVKPYNSETDEYHREPFVGNVSERKTDPVYMAHTYHTKVPYNAIKKFIEFYTKEGDIVLDIFCGSGMTGVAAQKCKRKSILIDLSPICGFISSNYNKPVDTNRFENETKKIISEIKTELGWMYKTIHKSSLFDNSKIFGEINYIIWSDIYICPYCRNNFSHWDVAVNIDKFELRNKFTCPNCNVELSKSDCMPLFSNHYDNSLNREVKLIKQVPCFIDYIFGNKHFQKKPDEYDLNMIKKIDNLEIPQWFPIDKLPLGHNTSQPIKSHGYQYVHQFFTKRNLWIISRLWEKMEKTSQKFLITSFMVKTGSKFHNIGMKSGSINLAGQVPGTLYIPSFTAERNIFKLTLEKLKYISKGINNGRYDEYMVSTQSATNLLNIPQNSIDYIFVDPPFGANLMYSELSYIWESWLKIKTNNKEEAIINDSQQKGLFEYTTLMTQCFRELYRVLKPNRWITIEFHNSKASVWNSIQEALVRAGFIIAQVAVFDKGQGTFKQQTSPGAVKNDLVINAYKPIKEFAQRFLKNAGEGMEVDFVVQQLEHLPIKPNIERTEKMLYSKMLAHYVENGFKIKYDSTKFYKLLSDNFVELDGYWFLDQQVLQYNEWKRSLSLDKLKEVLNGQQILIVSDENSALVWLYNFLNEQKTYSEIYTAYQRVATTTDDKIPELRELLDNNFIYEDGKYRRPLNKIEKEEINKNREKELDHEFQRLLKQAKETKGKIKNVRREALVYGFTKCYQNERYDHILTVADKLYGNTIEASGDIMDFIDIARIKASGGTNRMWD